MRIEMWGDEIDSIRTFDVESQRSIENLESIRIYPATDFPEEQAKRVSFLDYFDKKTSMLFLDEPVRLIEKGESVEEEFCAGTGKPYGMWVCGLGRGDETVLHKRDCRQDESIL